MRSITLEEHFWTDGFRKAIGTESRFALEPLLLDLGAGRIAAMDDGGIDMQVLSLSADGMDKLDGATATSVAREVNDELASAIAAHPDRFSGFATLGTKEPESAAKELDRCVQRLGLKGAMLHGTTNGEFLDQPKFLPVWEAADALGVPIYLHPASPPPAVMDAYFSGLPDDLGFMLSIAGWGWHAETALHTLRLIVSGLFERLPNLQLIIGHMGEGVPAALIRSSNALSRSAKLPMTVTDYFLRNIHVTTSGYFTVPPFQLARDVIGIDHLLYSVDYPYSANTLGKTFLESLALNADDLAKLTHANAERLLNIPSTL